MEVGHTAQRVALEGLRANTDLGEDLTAYAEQIVTGISQHRAEIDGRLAKLIRDYAYERVAAVDRNLMRLAAYELIYVDDVPPAVTLNEAVEIAKKYSTAESGRFVNGVLGQLLLGTPKANWVPPTTPGEPTDEEPDAPEPEPEVEEIPEGPEAEKLLKVGAWKIRRGDDA